MNNLTVFTEFVMDISTSRELQVLQGLMFLMMYLEALTGNLLTIIIIVTDHYLHSPMYFFLGNLSLRDLCCISVTVSKTVVNSLSDCKLISLSACAAQIFLFILFGCTEFFFLVVMSYDHYVAICHPLHYRLIVTPCLCTQAAGGSWLCELVHSSIHTGVMFRLPVTESNVNHQCFCDVPQIFRIFSSDVQFSESMVLIFSACNFLVCCAFVFKYYIDIFSMVLKMHSVEAHNKALSTSTPHLAILFLFLVSGWITAFGTTVNKESLSSLLTGMFYIMVPPIINPIIYSLQNKEIKTSLCRMFHRYFKMLSSVFLD